MLQKRCKDAENEESEAAVAMTIKTGLAPPKLPSSHNNAADLARRLAVYAGLRAADDADKEQRVCVFRQSAVTPDLHAVLHGVSRCSTSACILRSTRTSIMRAAYCSSGKMGVEAGC